VISPQASSASKDEGRGCSVPHATKEEVAVQRAEGILGFTFTSRALLRRALTHRSWAHERGRGDHNERLELLGDAVIGLVVTEDIFARFDSMGEGELTQLKSFLVSRRLQARAARKLGLDGCLLMGSSEEKSDITARVSTLANLFEAVVGALYLDGGLPHCADFLRRTILCHAKAPSPLDLKDPKTALQELVQGREPIQPQYRLVSVAGPDHLPTFTVDVVVGGDVLARGSGASKKDAEREAARNALIRLEGDGRQADPPADGVPAQ
jgi:ribonuclease-3